MPTNTAENKDSVKLDIDVIDPDSNEVLFEKDAVVQVVKRLSRNRVKISLGEGKCHVILESHEYSDV